MDHVFMERKHQVLSSSLVGNWEGISVRYSNNGSTSSTTIWRNVKIEIANNVLGLRNGKYVLAKGEGYSQWKNYNIPFDVVIKSRQINFGGVLRATCCQRWKHLSSPQGRKKLQA